MTTVTETPYRSRQETFLAGLRDHIMLNKTLSMVDRRWAWQYMYRYLFLDDLQSWAITQLGNGLAVQMGEGTLLPKLILVTPERSTPEEWKLQDAIVGATGLNPRDVYRTWQVKAGRQALNDISIYETVLKSELAQLKAPAIVLFGICLPDLELEYGLVQEWKESRVVITRPISDILPQNGTEHMEIKREVWAHIKNVVPYVDS